MTPTTPTSGAADLPEALRSCVEDIMAQAQVFASAWSLVGGMFDSGNGLENANAMQSELHAKVVALAAGQATAQAVVPAGWKLAPISWSAPSEPNENIRYNHITADTALGKFTIEWKGWKDNDSMCLYLDGDYVDTAVDVDGAKQIALEHLQKIADKLVVAAPAQPAAQQGVAYAALPQGESPCMFNLSDPDLRVYTKDDMRDFSDRTHALRVASHGQAPAQPLELCMSTPPGWRCTRKAGHEGPCAAVRCPEELEFVARGMERLKAAEAVSQPTTTPQADSVQEDAALSTIKQAIRDYHFALDCREHGGVAMARAWNAICNVLHMDWEQGAEAAARAAQKEGE